MIVSEKLIIELQEIIKQEYGEEVTLAEASAIGNGMAGYFDLLAKMHHENKD